VQCETDGNRKNVALTFNNTGAAGAAFNVYATGGAAGPWFFTVEAGKQLRHNLLTNVDSYDITVFGPNGFWRRYRGAPDAPLDIVAITRPAERALILSVRNRGTANITASVRAQAYTDYFQEQVLQPGGGTQFFFGNSASADWYDIELTTSAAPDFLQRFAGHIETGAPSFSDPLIGAAAPS
jgi:phospholipase C